MIRRTVTAFVLVAAVACERQPTAPNLGDGRAALLDKAPDNGPPSSYPFGPDTREIGTNTGPSDQAGLNCQADASGRQTCTGYLASAVDGTLLDVTVDVPAPDPSNPTARHALVALLHGWAGSKNGSGDIVDRLLSDGHAVLRYSARGFGNSYGKVNLADVGVEAGAPAPAGDCPVAPPGDLQSMIAQVLDFRHEDGTDLSLNPDAVAVTGASYGGGQSWLATLQPQFRTPAGQCVRLRAVVPIVPWTDLLYSLVPNGETRSSFEPPGALKLSYVDALFVSGQRKPDEGPQPWYDNYPAYLRAWHAWLNTVEPTREDPVFRQIVDGLAGHRSIWWQQSFWSNVGTSPIPVFQVQGFTDDLFTFEEARRILLALKTVNPSYPITSYFGDIGHPRAANKPGEVDYALDLISEWLRAYLNDVTGDEPAPIIYAAPTRPNTSSFDPAQVIKVATYEELSTGVLTHEFDQSFVLVNPLSGAASSPFWDPLFQAGASALVGAGELDPWTPKTPTTIVPDPTVAAYEVPVGTLTGGNGMLIAGQPVVTLKAHTLAPRVQLNVRLLDVAPDGTAYLITRGTYTLDPDRPVIGSAKVTIQTAGNLWSAAADHVLRLEIFTNDNPYLRPSAIPSETEISKVEVTIPVR